MRHPTWIHFDLRIVITLLCKTNISNINVWFQVKPPRSRIELFNFNGLVICPDETCSNSTMIRGLATWLAQTIATLEAQFWVGQNLTSPWNVGWNLTLPGFYHGYIMLHHYFVVRELCIVLLQSPSLVGQIFWVSHPNLAPFWLDSQWLTVSWQF